MFSYLDRLEKKYGLPEVTRRARRYTWGTYGLLFLVALSSGMAIYRQGGAELMPVLIRLLPLALFLPVLMTERVRGYIWLAFISVLYFIQGIVITSLPQHAWLGWFEMLASVALFLCAVIFVRWRRRQLKTAGSTKNTP
ncbi:DUF2069 domain-containing protein [Phytohalomonas tamaricis]|uniref:DUF2069 domain-containing protein n=1 Tax=Phytohalomonas tamaricis TaxID=2081032 RepID=UPI0021D44361|nr:DUF2069 domain-containing protein [Phytohalomonas tamaricis]